MKKQNWGRIVNTTSIAVKVNKWADTLKHYIKVLAEKRTHSQVLEYEKAIEEMEKDIPLRRIIGSPEELAALACFLASEKASYMTGTTIQVDGGLLRGIF